MSSISGNFKTYQKSGDVWNQVMSTTASLGTKGLVNDAERIEGDKKTPIGIYTILSAFGIKADPGTKLPFNSVGPNIYFDGQYGSPTYDQFLVGKPDNNEWEYMNVPPLYNYGLLINFNPEQTPGKGNAIFIHVYKSYGSPTTGCVGISESNIVSLLKWIDPAQNPEILICLSSDLAKYFN